MTARQAGKASTLCELYKAFAIACFRSLRRPRCQIVPFQSGGKFRRPPEKASRLGQRETRKPRRFKKGGIAVGGLDQALQRRRQRRGQAEAAVNGRQQAMLDRLVAVADHRLERRNHVADYVFRRVVQQHGKAAFGVETRRLGSRQRLDQKRVLGDRIDVRALGLPVPARDTREPVRDVFELDVERRGVEQIEPAAGQHALPGAWGLAASRLAHLRLASFATAAWRWQVSRWSLTMPTACMKA